MTKLLFIGAFLKVYYKKLTFEELWRQKWKDDLSFKTLPSFQTNIKAFGRYPSTPFLIKNVNENKKRYFTVQLTSFTVLIHQMIRLIRNITKDHFSFTKEESKTNISNPKKTEPMG